jgi:hypothetical protein
MPAIDGFVRQIQTYRIDLPTRVAAIFETTAKIVGMAPDELFRRMLEDFIATDPNVTPLYTSGPVGGEDPYLDMPLDDLACSVRLANILQQANLLLVRDVVYSPHATIRSCGKMTDKTFRELTTLLKDKAISWPEAGRAG